MTLTDIWNLMRSCCLRWDHVDKNNASYNHKLLYQDVCADMKMLRQFACEVESSRWILLNNATEWYPLACALLSHCQQVKLSDVAEIMQRIRYIPAINIDDDIFLQNFNGKVFDGYNWQRLISEFSNNAYLLAAAMILNIEFEDEDFLLSFDKNNVNVSVSSHFQARIERIRSTKQAAI